MKLIISLNIPRPESLAKNYNEIAESELDISLDEKLYQKFQHRNVLVDFMIEIEKEILARVKDIDKFPRSVTN